MIEEIKGRLFYSNHIKQYDTIIRLNGIEVTWDELCECITKMLSILVVPHEIIKREKQVYEAVNKAKQARASRNNAQVNIQYFFEEK